MRSFVSPIHSAWSMSWSVQIATNVGIIVWCNIYINKLSDCVLFRCGFLRLICDRFVVVNYLTLLILLAFEHCLEIAVLHQCTVKKCTAKKRTAKKRTAKNVWNKWYTVDLFRPMDNLFNKAFYSGGSYGLS